MTESKWKEELETIPVICTSHLSAKDRDKLKGWRENPTCVDAIVRIELSALVTMENEFGWILNTGEFEEDEPFFQHVRNEFSNYLAELLLYYRNKGYKYVWLDSDSSENPELKTFKD